jgi:hypothetical protein
MPLWIIFTKWPEPTGPQCSQPCSAVPAIFSRPGVRGMLPMPGASVSKIGASRAMASGWPPHIRQ